MCCPCMRRGGEDKGEGCVGEGGAEERRTGGEVRFGSVHGALGGIAGNERIRGDDAPARAHDIPSNSSRALRMSAQRM